jgi:hypothetical protein
VKYPEVERLRLVTGRTDFTFLQADILWHELEETDLLFLDTWHVYEQLHEELAPHAGKVRKYIVIHGTGAYAERGEDDGHQGLAPAIEQLVLHRDFRIKQQRLEGSGQWTDNT